jgi:DNA (cytosine-5)-methyltransferase 1
MLAVEWDDHAASTFRANFPDVPLFHGDIAKLSAIEVLSRTGLRPGELDVFDGSPPCQGFSTSGKRELTDTRNQLFREYVRLLTELRPKAFVMENVSGMVKGKMRVLFAEILSTLKEAGYRVKVRLLNAAFFGVPQSRERMIFVGVREDLAPDPVHPTPISKPTTARAALEGCSDGGLPLLEGKYARFYPHIRPGGSMADVMEKIRGKRSHFSDLVKLDPDCPSRTLMKTATDRGFATFVHWAIPRAISIAEAKRLGSFPDPFELHGTYQDCWARIGNSVPPLFMYQIARTIRERILNR